MTRKTPASAIIKHHLAQTTVALRGLQTLRLPTSCVESKAIDTVEFCFQRVRERSIIVYREKMKRGQQSTLLGFFKKKAPDAR